MELLWTLALHPPHAHLVGRGEFDAFSAGRIRERLEDAIDSGCIHFTLDASEVTFIDAGGLGLLVRLRNAVVPFGGGVAVTAASGRFRRVARLAGLDDAFDLDLLRDEPASAAGRGHLSLGCRPACG